MRMTELELVWKRDLGARVRGLRDARALTRHALAERSGLSLRFLADVESGKANPSLGSLHELAAALDVDVIALLEPLTSERPVALLGLRGAGKSTVGKRVARALGRRFVELDREIEREAGMSLAELFALHGEAHYRTLEQRVLVALLSTRSGGEKPLVVATGGGIVTHDESFRFLKSRSLTVWLKATPQEHWDRVLAQGDVRPMDKRAQARAELEALYAARAPAYSSAELVVDTSRQGVDESAAAIVAAARSSPRAPLRA
jgi:XRE family transcriptional regulator, aerobic/anaerobic benzoate catabolism transcriptional regulator